LAVHADSDLAETGYGDRAVPLIDATAALRRADRVTTLAQLVS
jgi:hypothetical protein